MTNLPPSTAGAASGSVFAGADLCSLAGLALPKGVHGPLFEQDLWSFHQVLGLPAYLKNWMKELDFRTIRNPRWRIVAKEYIAALLAPGHPAVRELPRANRTALTLQTCHGRLHYVTDWLNWLTEQGITELGQVTDRHCEAYSQLRSHRYDTQQKTLVRQKNVHALAVTAVIALAQYGELFSTDRYLPGLRPFHGRNPRQISGRSNTGENKIQPVPEEILQPLLAAALFFTQTLGPRIVAERERVSRLQNPGPGRRPKGRKAEAIANLERVLEHHRAEGIPLLLSATGDANRKRLGMPDADDPLRAVSLRDLARQAGYRAFAAHWLPDIRPSLEATLAAVGVAEPYGRGAELVERADGQGRVPWTEPMSAIALRDAVYFTRTATLIVIAAVSGMRSSELHELAVGCCLPPVERLPGLFRYRLAGRVVKGRPMGGEDDLWVVSCEAYEAAQLATRLLGPRAQPGDVLFNDAGLKKKYEAFRRWVNGPRGRRLGLSPIPAGPVNIRMLRRTLAMEIAYRPGGLLAGKLQLKHLSVLTTEGYAARPGGAQARLLAEINEHEQQHKQDLLLAEYRHYQRGVMPSGPGARDLIEFFASVDGELASTPSAPAVWGSDHEVRALVSHRARTLHLGTANYCWFTDPSKALCLQLAGTPKADRPLAGLCDSARCPQATHHLCHRPVWTETIRTNTAFLDGLPRAQKGEHARLARAVTRAQRVVAEIDAATGDRNGQGEEA